MNQRRPMLRATHTYVELEVSALAYDEIADKLRAANYDHCFDGEAIDMIGIALIKAKPDEVKEEIKLPLHRKHHR